ncbi:MAG: selenocysteine-specific translation elongation factor [Betaproteobacteria bacterium]|nr:selenocysteine-specific translation elongation factor [Betaproteobacteria bacterium]
MIIATAGHVDHGKTSLVRALTGVDTDRLAEEKRRGLTIDLGFAYAPLGGGEPVGFIDVPGHERFLRNMLAGVSRVDLALLVVAADDGPMPQTREHLAILGLTGARALVVALTKIDRVAPAQVAQARAQVHGLLAGSPWADAPVFPVSTPTGEGLAALRAHLAAAAAAAAPDQPQGHFRLAIDRAFSVAGAGLVLTGTVLSGRALPGDSLVISPLGREGRVRGIHAQGAPAGEARQGQRCAINVVVGGLQPEQAGRGQWLLAPSLHAPTQRIDVRLRLLPLEGGAAVRRGAQLQVHLGADAVGCQLAWLDEDDAPAGPERLAQLILARPVSALRGDRLVLREPAAGRTLGGGEVLDPFAPARGRSRPERRLLLAGWGRSDAASSLQALLQASAAGLPVEPFARAWNLLPDALDALFDAGQTARPAGPRPALAIDPARWQAWQASTTRCLARHHEVEPARIGPIESELLDAMIDEQKAESAVWPSGRDQARQVARAALAAQVAAGAVVREGASLRLPDHEPRLAPADAALLARVMPMLRASLLRPPIVGELAAALGQERADLLTFLRRMSALGHVLPVAPNRFFAPEALAALAAIARSLAGASPDGRFDAAAYRDASGIGRNLTIEVLEYLDRAGITRFAGERRQLIAP